VGHLLNYGLPADLCARFSENVHRPASLVNDAKAWLKVAMTYANWMWLPFNYPAAALIFGTGIGFAHAKGPAVVAAQEFGGKFKGRELARFVGREALQNSWMCMGFSGRDFFNGWTRNKTSGTTRRSALSSRTG